jgi:hypothetical protein
MDTEAKDGAADSLEIRDVRAGHTLEVSPSQIREKRGEWYNWTTRHPIRDPLAVSILKGGAAETAVD